MKRRLWHSIGLIAIALGAAALGAASGCTEVTNDVTLDDAGVYEASDAAVSTCPACVENECAGAWALCLTSASCLAVRACATASGCDATCATSCACEPESDGGKEGGRLYRAYAACDDAHRCGSCGSDCGTSCPGAGTTAPGSCNDEDAGAAPAVATADGCARCTSDACSGPLQSCAAGSECAAWLTCVHACADDACRNSCDALHATGKAAALELAACAGASCVTECGL